MILLFSIFSSVLPCFCANRAMICPGHAVLQALGAVKGNPPVGPKC
jgi:hypothetical protein